MSNSQIPRGNEEAARSERSVSGFSAKKEITHEVIIVPQL
jgi:hypothetical protein